MCTAWQSLGTSSIKQRQYADQDRKAFVHAHEYGEYVQHEQYLRGKTIYIVYRNYLAREGTELAGAEYSSPQAAAAAEISTSSSSRNTSESSATRAA